MLSTHASNNYRDRISRLVQIIDVGTVIVCSKYRYTKQEQKKKKRKNQLIIQSNYYARGDYFRCETKTLGKF